MLQGCHKDKIRPLPSCIPKCYLKKEKEEGKNLRKTESSKQHYSKCDLWASASPQMITGLK